MGLDEKEVGVSRKPLTLSVNLRNLGELLKIAPSSNGKTTDSGSVYRGSNPCGAARGPLPRILTSEFSRPYRLTV